MHNKRYFKKINQSGFGFHDTSRSGKTQKIAINVDRLMKRKSSADPRRTADDIAQELRGENLIDVIHVTVSRKNYTRTSKNILVLI